jgi:D-lactate dehydrogenase
MIAPSCNIYFVETESREQRLFTEELKRHTVRFVSSLEAVGPDAEILSIFIHSRIARDFLAQHPAVRLIATRSSGYDHIDLAECRNRGVTVCSVSSYGDNSVAEHTLALMLALARRTREAREACRHRTFSYAATRAFELKGATLGVIGAGRIGLHVIRLARAFEMTVVVTDVHCEAHLQEVLGFRYVSLDELLPIADIITLHVPLTPATHHLLNREAFAKCKRGVLIVNTARGAVIDTAALIEALDNGVVAGAGLDVIEEERVMRQEWSTLVAHAIIEDLHATASSDEPRVVDSQRLAELQALLHNGTLIARPNVVFTPHIAFNSVQAVERINRTTVGNIQAFLAGRPVNVIGVSAGAESEMKKQ